MILHILLIYVIRSASVSVSDNSDFETDTACIRQAILRLTNFLLFHLFHGDPDRSPELSIIRQSEGTKDMVD